MSMLVELSKRRRSPRVKALFKRDPSETGGRSSFKLREKKNEIRDFWIDFFDIWYLILRSIILPIILKAVEKNESWIVSSR